MVDHDNGNGSAIDINDEFCWSLNKRSKLANMVSSEKKIESKKIDLNISFDFEKFEKLKKKAAEISTGSALRQQKTELRKSKRVLKKAMKDPDINAAVNGIYIESQEKTSDRISWNDVKPFLNVNDHLAGPVPQGNYTPKTELETMIDNCIKEGDFEKAEILSDTLANREFAVKITHAFDARKYHDHLEEQKKIEKKKQSKKINWTFSAKERWQMKGNM